MAKNYREVLDQIPSLNIIKNDIYKDVLQKYGEDDDLVKLIKSNSPMIAGLGSGEPTYFKNDYLSIPDSSIRDEKSFGASDANLAFVIHIPSYNRMDMSLFVKAGDGLYSYDDYESIDAFINKYDVSDWLSFFNRAMKSITNKASGKGGKKLFKDLGAFESAVEELGEFSYKDFMRGLNKEWLSISDSEVNTEDLNNLIKKDLDFSEGLYDLLYSDESDLMDKVIDFVFEGLKNYKYNNSGE